MTPEIRRAADPSLEAWRRLAEGEGARRPRGMLVLDPSCRDGACVYYDTEAGRCRLLDSGVPWRLGVCRHRAFAP